MTNSIISHTVQIVILKNIMTENNVKDVHIKNSVVVNQNIEQ